MYLTDLHQIFRVERHMVGSGTDKPYIRFEVVQGTLLWYPINFKGKNRTLIDTTFILCIGVL